MKRAEISDIQEAFPIFQELLKRKNLNLEICLLIIYYDRNLFLIS